MNSNPPFSRKGRRDQKAMKAQGLTLAAIAAEMETSRARLNRALDPAASNVMLSTLSRAAKVWGVEGGAGLGR